MMLRAFLYLSLALSLAANVWFISRSRPAPESPRTTAGSKQPAAPVPDTGTGERAPVAGPVNPPTTEAEFKALRGRLEALGLPSDVVRVMLLQLVQRGFQRRQAELLGLAGADEYWRNPIPRVDPAAQSALQELGREQRRLLRELGGQDLELDENAQRRLFGGLPDAKVAQLKRILADYAELEEAQNSDGSERGRAELRARAELLAREKRADIERLLTPEELLNYDLRNSHAANRLRGKIGQFAVTETEFRALYPLFKATLDTVGGGTDASGNVADARRAREAAERQLDEQLRRGLGEARYQELQEANDHLLQQTRAFTASLNLPPSVATEVVAVQKEYSPKLTALDRDRDLTPNQRDARVSALGIEARDRLIRALGPAGFEAYRRQAGGWLGAALARTPPTSSTSP
ncbi:MAG: hypothetical protein JNL92_22330 [Opitutaceae bacterium]|nr:hypothetical protein [Opitutaceae bacterium]